MSNLLTISGIVYSQVDGTKKLLPQASVKATRSINGTQFDIWEVQTNQNGQYAFDQLTPGRWCLTATASQYAESRPEVVVLGLKSVELPIELTATARVKGQVARSKTHGRLKNVVIEASAADSPSKFCHSDSNGLFRFDDLTPGEWTFRAFHERYNSIEKKQQKVPLANGETLMFELQRRSETVDERSGQHFFVVLCSLLALIAVIYVLLHIVSPPLAQPLSKPLAQLIGQAKEQVSATELFSATGSISATLATVRAALETTLANDTLALNDAERQVIAGMLRRSEDAIRGNHKDMALSELNALYTAVATPTRTTYFWSGDPGRFLEAVFWGLAGVLLLLIVTISRYLRNGTYYREGIYYHVGHLLTAPLLTLIVVLLLSLITVKLTLSGGAEVQLDMSNPNILVPVAFLLGLSYWRVYDLLVGLAGQLPGFGLPEHEPNNR